jgi:hypothetical protein
MLLKANHVLVSIPRQLYWIVWSQDYKLDFYNFTLSIENNVSSRLHSNAYKATWSFVLLRLYHGSSVGYPMWCTCPLIITLHQHCLSSIENNHALSYGTTMQTLSYGATMAHILCGLTWGLPPIVAQPSWSPTHSLLPSTLVTCENLEIIF